MSTRPATQGDVAEARADGATNLARAREEWRDELKLVLRGFKNEMRLTIAVAVLILKFNVPPQVTAVTVTALVGKTFLGAFWRN